MADPVFVDDVTPLDAANMNKLQTRDEKAAANGYPSLGADGKVPLAQLPAIGGGADLSYDGDWVAGTYQDGDVVVKDGVAYICVGGPTTDAPSIAPWGQAGLSVIGDELAYAEIVADVAVTGNTTATAGAIATAPAVTLDGATPITVEFFAATVDIPSGAAMLFGLFDNGVVVPSQQWGQDSNLHSGVDRHPKYLKMRLTPSAGSHTFSVRAWSGTAGGLVRAVAGSYAPAFIRVSRVFPAQPQVGVGALTAVTYGTTLPASPADGQEAILVDSVTAPSYQWRFRYNAGSSSAYKWEFIGGADLLAAEIATAEQTASTTYVNLTTVGPSLVVPRAGVYEISGAVVGATGGSTADGIMSVKLGAAATTDAEMIANWRSNMGAPGTLGGGRHFRRTLAAGDTLLGQYRTYAGAAWIFSFRSIYVVPVRVA